MSYSGLEQRAHALSRGGVTEEPGTKNGGYFQKPRLPINGSEDTNGSRTALSRFQGRHRFQVFPREVFRISWQSMRVLRWTLGQTAVCVVKRDRRCRGTVTGPAILHQGDDVEP